MQLVKWDSPTDTFNYVDLAENFSKLDVHDHSNGYGRQITSDGLANGSVKSPQLALDSVGSTNLQKDSVIREKIKNGSVNGDKLDANSVTTVKISNLNVTAPKLSQDIQDSLYSKYYPSTLPTGTVSGQRIRVPSVGYYPGVWDLAWSTAGYWHFAGGPPANWFKGTFPNNSSNHNQNANAVDDGYKEIYTSNDTSTPLLIKLPYKGTYLLQGYIDLKITQTSGSTKFGGVVAIGGDVSSLDDKSTASLEYDAGNGGVFETTIHVAKTVTISSVSGNGGDVKMYHRPQTGSSCITLPIGGGFTATPIHLNP